jgi:hypothetical protein
MHIAMDGGEIERAIERLQLAVDRLDAIAARYSDLSVGQDHIVLRHERLREQVGAAISELDAVIGAKNG